MNKSGGVIVVSDSDPSMDVALFRQLNRMAGSVPHCDILYEFQRFLGEHGIYFTVFGDIGHIRPGRFSGLATD